MHKFTKVAKIMLTEQARNQSHVNKPEKVLLPVLQRRGVFPLSSTTYGICINGGTDSIWYPACDDFDCPAEHVHNRSFCMKKSASMSVM